MNTNISICCIKCRKIDLLFVRDQPEADWIEVVLQVTATKNEHVEFVFSDLVGGVRMKYAQIILVGCASILEQVGGLMVQWKDSRS